MKNVTLSMDDELLQAARAFAARRQTTLNQLVRDVLKRTVEADRDANIRELIRVLEKNQGDSRGWKWNRKELYGDRW